MTASLVWMLTSTFRATPYTSALLQSFLELRAPWLVWRETCVPEDPLDIDFARSVHIAGLLITMCTLTLNLALLDLLLLSGFAKC